MKGIKKFKNETCFKLKVELSIRKGEEVGCTFKKEEFCLKPFEARTIEFGNECNFLLNGIHIQTIDCEQCSETGLFTCKCHTPIDKLLNKNDLFKILIAAQSLVISGYCVK
ncbi:hypothetical protein GCM10023142_39950 [Anaerocolumna aminovalerica]|jgi:hypothetical protein|uniref:Uncharacterized protein n=1 Tax=Anaerocolumna aminovalerica TaxID=1527 RepID=A0A1I5EXM6_9FIRM|nr:hypothetical protein [Anaerocolumna aminovalerica]MBU5332065.1 hypothetical protein [Anaerocolumna aminovalerica]MDU6266232.1 hypothetical protein [Anaerocolumna aminovalerica]SFO16136.1 hypothetical protein SAMN04489757_11154 [Anaerocolumna aminovalerica]